MIFSEPMKQIETQNYKLKKYEMTISWTYLLQ